MNNEMLQNVEAVIFDLDGTLVDSMWMWRSIDIEYLNRFGIPLPEQLQSEIEGMSFSETAVYFKEHFSIPDSLDQIKADWNRMAMEYYQTKVPVKPGVIPFLTYLKKRNIKTGIATSNSRALLDAVLDAVNLRQYFDAIHTSCEVEKGKPWPDIYLYVAKKLGTAPERCLVFEDIEPGILAGQAAGMKVCAIYDDYSVTQQEHFKKLADYYMKTWEEFPYEENRKG